jgi:hypothetical protein
MNRSRVLVLVLPVISISQEGAAAVARYLAEGLGGWLFVLDWR